MGPEVRSVRPGQVEKSSEENFYVAERDLALGIMDPCIELELSREFLYFGSKCS